MENLPNIDVLALISAAVERGEHGCEADLTSYAAASLAADPDRNLWCSNSKNGKSHHLRVKPNVNCSFLGARSYDLAYGSRDAAKPATLVQIKYDRGHGNGTNQPRNHALRDILYMAVDLKRLGEGTECHMVSVVHRNNMVKAHRWLPFCEEAEWTFRCEPLTIQAVGKQKGGFLDESNRLIVPKTINQANEVFGTHWQTPGHGLFARAGVLTVRFRTRSRSVGDFTIFDWQLIEASFEGANLPLLEWLP